jgi:hypothetical protein
VRATGPHRLAPSEDPVEPGATAAITVHVDGLPVSGLAGQTIAGILLGAGRGSWRSTRRGRPRGVFCGIGVCYDCLLTVNGLSDVRACQRRAADGDVITTKVEISGRRTSRDTTAVDAADIREDDVVSGVAAAGGLGAGDADGRAGSAGTPHGSTSTPRRAGPAPRRSRPGGGGA